MARAFGKTIEAFMECLKMALEGKTFIYVHKDFVAVDSKTWARIHAERMPSIPFYDEFGSITDEQLEELEKILQERKR